MFKSVYQGGAHVEVFSAQGKDPVGKWKLHGKANAIRKEYDQELRGFVYVLEGGSTVTRMQLPKSDRQHLSLLQPCFILQMHVPESANVSVELCISDSGGSRRRIFLSSAHKDTSATPLHARVPLSSLPRGEWFNLCINLTNLVPNLFRGQQFKSVESVTVGGSCRLRRVFTMKTKPGTIPASYVIPHFTEQKIISVPSDASTASDDSMDIDGCSDVDKPSHVAFGTKIRIPDHVLKSRMSARNSDPMIASVSSMSSDSGSFVASKREHKTTSFSTKAVLPKIQQKKATITPRELSSDREHVKPKDKPVPSAEYSPAAYTDIQDDNIVDKGTQLAIDVLHSQSDTSVLYHYSSHPHSAHRNSPNTSLLSDRGPNMDDDFYSSGSSSSVGDTAIQASPSYVQRPKQQSRFTDQVDTTPEPTVNQEVSLMRLSQVYDWRQYQSSDTQIDGSHDPNGGPHDSLETPHHSIIVGPTDSDEDTSLSATMTGLNNRLLETPVRTSLEDTLERVTSPDTLTRTLDQPLPAQILQQKEQEKELDLVYDPCFNCFYDPKSAKYYQLK